MDITLIWFPLMKMIVTLILGYGAYYFIKTKREKVAIWYVFLLTLFWIFMPIKYDATNSVERHEVTQKMRTEQYKEVRREATVKQTTKPTFQERMDAESKRSTQANEKVRDGIID